MADVTDTEEFNRVLFTAENVRDKLKIPAHGLLDAPRNEDLVATLDLVIRMVHELRANGKLPV